MVEIIVFDSAQIGLLGGLTVLCRNKETRKRLGSVYHLESMKRAMEAVEDYKNWYGPANCEVNIVERN